jgi:DNA-binding HxlR family transcriptional regulator
MDETIVFTTKREIDQAADVLRVLGKRWTLPILKSVGPNALRFNELKRALSGISGTVLSQRLLELERMGLVTKQVHVETPPRVEYRSIARAKGLEAMLEGLGRWMLRRFPMRDRFDHFGT